jgi:hypothetical protein
MKKKIIIELDKILLGDLKYLLSYKKLIDIIIDNCKHKKINENMCNINKDLWKKNISPYFFRPYIKEFFKKNKSKYDFYIFTSIDKDIAIELVELIEEYVNISFKKPIYTREDLLINSFNNYQKNICFFSPLSSFIIIDDMKYWPEKTKIITPKIYNYVYIPNIDSNILHILRNIEFKKNLDIIPFITTNNFDEFYLNYHLFTAELLNSIKYNNEENIKDDYLKMLNIN